MSKTASRLTSGYDLARVDAHRIKPAEYKELPELTDDMLARAVVKKGGRPRSANPRQLISLRLPTDVIARWRATGPGVANAHGRAAFEGAHRQGKERRLTCSGCGLGGRRFRAANRCSALFKTTPWTIKSR